MSKNLDEIDEKKSGIIKLKNPNILQNEKVKGSSDDFMSENELSEMNEEYKTGRWHPDEHYRFIKGCLQFGNNWKKVKECVKTRSSAQIRSHAQKYIIKLCKKFNIQGCDKNMKSFKNIKRKLPSELMDDINWEKALEWNGDDNFENTNLNMEEIEEIILGIFKSNVSRNLGSKSPKLEEKEILQTGNEDKKIKVFETIKEPRNSLKKKQHRIHLQNQLKKANCQNTNGVNTNPLNNNNIFNLNIMNQLGLNDPHLQMILGNNLMTNVMNFNLGNFTPNMVLNNPNFNNPLGWDHLMNSMNFGFSGTIPPCSKKEEVLNKNNVVDNNLLSYLLNTNPNICMDFNNEELIRNLMKGNTGLNFNNLMGGCGNHNQAPLNWNNILNPDLQGVDNMNINELMMNLVNPAMNNIRNMNPYNEMMMQMFANSQGPDSAINNSNKNINNYNNSYNGNITSKSGNLVNSLHNNMNSSNGEKNLEVTPNNHPTNPNTFTLNQNNQQDPHLNKNHNLIISGEEISDNVGDVSKLEPLHKLANAMKIMTGASSGNNSSPNEAVSNLPEIFNSNGISNLQAPQNNFSLETTPLQLATSVSKETIKEASFNLKQENAENLNLINPCKPNDNLLSDDMSMMLINLLNSSNPQLPLGYDLNSFSQLLDLQNLSNLPPINNNINNNVNCSTTLKKQNDSSLNLDDKEKDKEEYNNNKTQISANQNVNNNNIPFNNNNLNFLNPQSNNLMGGNMDFNMNPNIFQQGNINNFIGDPILGWMNQFFIQPNNLMPTANTNNIPLFNSKSQMDNYFLNNFNPMDLCFDQNMINQNNTNTGNMKNNSEK